MRPNDPCLAGPDQWPRSGCRRHFQEQPFLDGNHPDWHSPLNQGLYRRDRGALFTMLRRPHDLKVSFYTDKIVNEQKYGARHFYERYEHNMSLAWEAMTGMQTAMLVGRWPLDGTGKPSANDLEKAKRRLRDGFAFVGLTHRWAESMCLFHARMGLGQCHACEFAKYNTGTEKMQRGEEKALPKLSEKDKAFLSTYRDDIDEPLLEYAEALFEERRRQHGATDSWCAACGCTAGRSHASNWDKL